MNTPSPQSENIWQRYWKALGGWQTLKDDHYLKVAFCLAVASVTLWIEPEWWDGVINVMAILIGFSVSTFSVALTLADRISDRLLRRSKFDNSSPLLTLIAGYVFYLLVGFLSLGASVMAKAWYKPHWLKNVDHDYDFLFQCLWVSARLYWFLCGVLFWYSLTSGVRCLMSVFRLSSIVQRLEDAANDAKTKAGAQHQKC